MENHYIHEFVEYYKKLGVKNIYIYDNNDKDGENFSDVINDYISSGYVKIIDYRGKKSTPKFNLQTAAYRDFYRNYAKNYDWLIIIDVDELSLKKEGRWPWPREKLARLVDALQKQQVRLIGFDVVFSEAELNPVSQVLASGQLSEATATELQPLVAQLDGDSQFAKVISKNTKECIQSGIVYGQAFMISEFARRMERELGYELDRVLTGGFSSVIKDQVVCYHYEPNIVLEGLYEIYKLNK